MAENNVLKDKLGKILNPKIPRYEILKYNLIDGANPIRTGRKVNGKDEYVKLVSMSLPNNNAVVVSAGLDFNNVTITRQISGYRKDASNQYANFPDNSASGFIRIYINSSGLNIQTNYDASTWTAYFYVYFTYNS